MQRVAREILRNGRSAEVDADLMSINEILQVIPGSKE
jgi:phosphoenolpyruvate phosphomutase